MTRFPFTCTPEALALSDKPIWISATDGDTPTIQVPVRMLGIDAPELHSELRNYLAPRLCAKASIGQIAAGTVAFDHFAQMVCQRLDRGVGRNGKPLAPRRLFVMVSKQAFDRYERPLAYENASYPKVERDRLVVAKRPPVAGPTSEEWLRSRVGHA